jgi:protein SCO1/2
MARANPKISGNFPEGENGFGALGVAAVVSRNCPRRDWPRGRLPFRFFFEAFVSILFVTTLALAALGASGCGGSSTGGSSSAPSATAPRIYHLQGTIVSIDKAKQQIVVNHQAIPGLMAAMTMGYPVAVEAAPMLDKLVPGDQITADVVVDDAGARLRNIVVVKKAEGATAAPAALRISPAASSPRGDSVPDFSLNNQDGKRISLRDSRGKALVISFIYTRCPLQDECPLTTHNFAAIEKALAANPALYGETHLLSVSFDPAYDTPAILRSYARGFGEDRFDHWEFAALPTSETREAVKFFNIFLSEQQGQISHSTCTAIIAPDGTLYRLYSGNDWKPDNLLGDLRNLLAPSGSDIAQERNEAAPR